MDGCVKMTTAGEPKTTRRKTRATLNFEISAEKRLSHRARATRKESGEKVRRARFHGDETTRKRSTTTF